MEVSSILRVVELVLFGAIGHAQNMPLHEPVIVPAQYVQVTALQSEYPSFLYDNNLHKNCIATGMYFGFLWSLEYGSYSYTFTCQLYEPDYPGIFAKKRPAYRANLAESGTFVIQREREWWERRH